MDPKYIFLLSRDLHKDEKDELKKWLCVYNYNPATANGRTVNELFNNYDAILITMSDSDNHQFYSENYKLLEEHPSVIRVYVGKLKDTKEHKDELIKAWHIDYFVKKITLKNASKDELLHKLLCVMLPKPKRTSWKDMIVLLLSNLISQLPKLFR